MVGGRRGWIWAGRVVFAGVLAGLAIHLWAIGLDKADKLASSIGVVVALAALAAPYLLPAGGEGDQVDRVSGSGDAIAEEGGRANSGVRGGRAGRPARVTRSGTARATGPGSVANTGVQRDDSR